MFTDVKMARFVNFTTRVKLAQKGRHSGWFALAKSAVCQVRPASSTPCFRLLLILTPVDCLRPMRRQRLSALSGPYWPAFKTRVRDAFDDFLPVLPAYQGVINDLDFRRFAEFWRSSSVACRFVCR
jgi:hypothetical protein